MRFPKWLVLVALLAGCDGDGDSVICNPGETYWCLCWPEAPESIVRTMVCNDDGTAFSECSCEPRTPFPPDAVTSDPCSSDAECQAIYPPTECLQSACDRGKCGLFFHSPEMSLPIQVPGDCVTRACDGTGNVVLHYGPGDVPQNIQGDCRKLVCDEV